jgi:hypothetical protein
VVIFYIFRIIFCMKNDKYVKCECKLMMVSYEVLLVMKIWLDFKVLLQLI